MAHTQGPNRRQPIGAESRIPEVINSHPQCRAVFDRYGMRGCGGPKGPAETVAWFARMHEVPLDLLLRELNESVEHPGRRILPLTSASTDTIYRPFFKTATLIGLGFGLWGAIVLSYMSATGGMQFAVPYGWLLTHGQTMINGFVVLMAMGFAFQALPRFKHTELWNPRLALAALPLMLVGLLLYGMAQVRVPPGVFQSDQDTLHAPLWALPVGLFGAALQWMSISVFALVMGRTLFGSSRRDGGDYLVAAALGWLWLSGLAQVFLFAYWWGVTDSESFVARVGPWNPVLRDAQIYGFAFQLVLGVSLRYLPQAYGFVRPPRWWTFALLVGVNVAVVLALVSFPMVVRTKTPAWGISLSVAYFALLCLLIGQVRVLGLLGRPSDFDRSLKFIRAAFAWGIAGLSMILLMKAYNSLTDQPFSHNYFAAYRHAIFGGFLLLMIAGVAGKVAPTMNGLEASTLNPLWGGFFLMNAGNAGRIAGQILMDVPQTTDWARWMAAAAGFVQWAGMALWVDDLWFCMRARSEDRIVSPQTHQVGPQTRVGDLLASHPRALEVLIREGFLPLANPILRRTVARTITLEQAARHLGKDPAGLLHQIMASMEEGTVAKASPPACTCCQAVPEDLT